MRNAVNARIVIPQYASLRLYTCGFDFSVTFNVAENLMQYLDKCEDTRIFTFRKGNRYYASIRQTFSYAEHNMEQVIWHRLPRMKQILLVAIKEAKIAQLKDEVFRLKVL